MKDTSSTTTIKTQNPVPTTSTSRPAFTNDFDNSSEPSREGSVLIVESHPYTHPYTFSVPSSDSEADTEDEEDEVQIASSVQGDEEEASAATTPDRQPVGRAYSVTEDHAPDAWARVARDETRGPDLEGPSSLDRLMTKMTKTAKDGTSQENPINLEGGCPNIIDVDTESEDEAPEAVPFFKPPQKYQSNRLKIFDEPQDVCQSTAVKLPTITAVTGKEDNRESENSRHSLVPETQARECNEDGGREHNPTNVCAESTTGASDSFDSEDDDGFDYEHEFFADDDLKPFVDPPALNVENPSGLRGFQNGDNPSRCAVLTPPFDDIHPPRPDHLSVSDVIDVSRPAEPPSAWNQRPPSPSDAALARKASEPKKSLGRDIFDNFPVPEWPAPAFHEEKFGAWPELQSPEPRSYDQGPFSTHPKVVVAIPRSPKPDNMKNQTRKATVTWAEPHEVNDDLVMKDRFARSGNKASKITIPSLVETYISEHPGSFKRKYGGMSGSKHVEAVPNESSPATRTSSHKRTFEEANPIGPSLSLEESSSVIMSQPPSEFTKLMWQSVVDEATQGQTGLHDQDTPLPDAQPRENLFNTSTTSTSQDSIAEPVLGSVPVTTPTQGQDEEGPARKKAKVLPSSSRGIGKFVLGVGVGLAGAAAAFIATIPASVYEEALREFGNAV